MNSNDYESAIVAGMREVARTSPAMRDPDAMEGRLLARFDAHHATVRSNWRRSLPIAAALLIAVGLPLGWLSSHRAPSADRRAPGPESDFIPWPGAAALPAFESGELVRTELPASVLPLLGIAQGDAPAGGSVTADVLYAQDGLARAVRLVNVQPLRP